MKPEVRVFSREAPCTKREEWRDVVGYEGRYRVSDFGRIMSLPTKYHPRTKILKPWYQTEQQYAFVSLSLDGTVVSRSVHSVVAEAFLGPRPEGLLVLHKDGVGSRSCASNLRYGTQSQNMLDRKRHGTETTPGAKLTRRQVYSIRRLLAMGHRPVEIAARFGVTPETIYLIRARKIWRDV